MRSEVVVVIFNISEYHNRIRSGTSERSRSDPYSCPVDRGVLKRGLSKVPRSDTYVGKIHKNPTTKNLSSGARRDFRPGNSITQGC